MRVSGARGNETTGVTGSWRLTGRVVRCLLCGTLVAVCTWFGATIPAHAESARTGTAVIEWNAATARAIGQACLVPGRDDEVEARMYAMVQISVHDALNGIDGRFATVASRAHSPQASPEMAVASASRTVLVALLRALPGASRTCTSAAQASVETSYARSSEMIDEGASKRLGTSIGETAARAVLAQGQATVGFFGIRSVPSVTPAPRYPEASVEYARDFEEVRAVGGDGIRTASTRTPHQAETVVFWHRRSSEVWNAIARSVAEAEHLDDWDSARLIALVNMAIGDATRASAATRYTTDYWPPVAAIRSADADGNHQTRADREWTPLHRVAATGGYDSARAVAAGGASAVLRTFFGRDMLSFSVCSSTVVDGASCGDGGTFVRTYQSFSQAANESGWSEILGGVHFRQAVRSGLDRGAHVGAALDRQLLPVSRAVSLTMGCTGRSHQPHPVGLHC